LHFLLELTASAEEYILRYAREHGTTRGCGIACTRIPATPNGRIHIQTTPTDSQKYPLPPEPDLPAILARLWNIPTDEITTDQKTFLVPSITCRPNLAAQHTKTKTPSKAHDGNGI
jgi:hypothetical protein